MLYNSDRIFSVLKNTTAITALLDNYTDSGGTRKAIFHDKIIPTDFTLQKSINFYRSSPVDTTLEYGDEVYTLNCRAENYEDAEAIQKQCSIAFNRTASQTDGFFTCRLLSIIEPADERDNYNAVIEVRIRRK